MATAIKIIVITLVLHFISDFNLQIGAKLHEMKQKSWWEKQLDKDSSLDPRLYRYDWICALLIHSFVWSAITFAPILSTVESGIGIAYCLIPNIAIHAMVDHAKANGHAMSLIEDQVCHLMQIGITLFVWMALS